jgi:hypothetical protein
MVTENLTRSETEEGTWEELTTTTAAHKIERRSLVLLQVNCKSIRNKTLDFWDLIHIMRM